MHVYVSSSITELGNNVLVVCPFQHLIFWTPYLTSYAHVSLAHKKIPTQNTIWHFTPKGRLFILMLLFLHYRWVSNLKSIPSTQPMEGPPPCTTGSSKTILPLYYLRRNWTFLISNYFRSNLVSSPMELDSNKANKDGSKETNPTWRFVKRWYIEGGCYGGPWQE